ncbi:kinase-like domain-containing protein [Aspergillus terricola var. indicus]
MFTHGKGKSAPRAQSTSTSSTSRMRASSSEAVLATKQYAETISEHMLRRETPSEAFITKDVLLRIWSNEKLKECAVLVGLNLCDQEIVRIREHLLRTFSILVHISWDGWPHFRELFLKGPESRLGYNDDMVMNCPSTVLEQGLGLLWGHRFHEKIPVFNPIIIRFGKDDEHPHGSRLPFLPEEDAQLGEGGYGRVTKEIIPTGQYLEQEGDLNATASPPLEVLNTKANKLPQNKIVARKVFHSKLSFMRERGNLKYLLNSLVHHKHILVPLAMVTVGESPSIVMELADCNLDTFLQESWEATPNITLASLVAQVEKLASALNHLHNPRAPDPKILHMDLTPKNILIKWRKNSPEGHWMLSDFGLARFILTQTQVPAGYLAHGESGVAMPEQHISPYKPPDKTYVPKSDVWSLGCILCRVVCRKRYGIEGLKAFDIARGKKSGQDGAEYGDDFFHREGALNPHVKEMLDRFCSESCEITRECGSLIYSILSVDMNKRPEALDVQSKLVRICQLREDPGPFASFKPNDPRGSGASVDAVRESISVNSFRDSIGESESGNRLSSQSSTESPPVGVGPLSPLTPESVPFKDPDWQPTRQSAIEPLFLAIKNQNEDDALTQLQALPAAEKPECLNSTHPKGGMTALGLAAQRGYTNVVDFLIDKNAEVDKKDRCGNTPLMYACKKGHCKTAQRLLERNANWNLQGADGKTCLHFATEAGKIKILELFMQKAPSAQPPLNANQVNRLDRTALEDHLRPDRSQHKRHEITIALLSLGAKPDYRSEKEEHECAADLVVDRGDTRVMALLVPKIRDWKLPMERKIPRDMRRLLERSSLIV